MHQAIHELNTPKNLQNRQSLNSKELLNKGKIRIAKIKEPMGIKKLSV